MNLQLPPDVAMQKKMQAVQQNQLYSMAFQIYTQLLPAHPNTPSGEIAIWSIEFAKTFNTVVADDVRKQKEEK